MAEQRIKVSRQFLSDFELVTQHYECPEQEIKWLKSQARKDYEMVKKSIECAASIIRKGGVF